MRRLLSLMLLLSLGLSAVQAQTTAGVTLYREFKPATVHLANGKKLSLPLANIFMKDGSLLYKSGTHTMTAKTRNVASVDFGDRTFVKIDTLLACMVDSVGKNALYCATLLDLDTYRRQAVNNEIVSSLSLQGDAVGVTTIELEADGEREFPVINHFYYLYNGKIVRAQERPLWRVLSKEKQRVFKTFVAMPAFSWQNKQSLLDLLQALSR